jgi:three-Cys-motif partner protein
MWEIQPQTEAKHELLVEYFNRWFPILAQGRPEGQQVLYVDGFAGPGRYSGGEPGSPIIAIRTALDHARLPSLLDRPEFRMTFAFVDADAAACKSLRDEISKLRVERSIPSQFEILDPEHGEFTEHMTDILKPFQDQSSPMGGALVFIDPFGPLGFPMSTIRTIMLNDRCEVFLRFNYTRLANNFMKRDEMDSRVDDLFGSSAWRAVAHAPTEQREDAIMETYLDCLGTYGNTKHTQLFRTSDRHGRVAYMIFGTNNCKGMEEMKDAMWKIDPEGRFRWGAKSPTAAGQTTFFHVIGNEQCEHEVAASLAAEFHGRVLMSQLEEHTRCHRDWLMRHLRPALTRLEGSGEILAVERPNGLQRRRGDFPHDSTVVFR